MQFKPSGFLVGFIFAAPSSRRADHSGGERKNRIAKEEI
jgi:hypothetical protein